MMETPSDTMMTTNSSENSPDLYGGLAEAICTWVEGKDIKEGKNIPLPPSIVGAIERRGFLELTEHDQKRVALYLIADPDSYREQYIDENLKPLRRE